MFKIALVGLLALTFYIFNVECMSDEMKEMAQMLHNTCVSQTGASEAHIEEARKGNFVEDGAFKCYIKCLGVELGSIDDDGVVDIEAALAVIPPEWKDKMTPMIKTCGTKAGSDPCDTAFLTHKCYYEFAPADYILL